jgi:hypothetical protein
MEEIVTLWILWGTACALGLIAKYYKSTGNE